MMVTIGPIHANNRKKAFEVTIGSRVRPIPYVKLKVPPSTSDPVVRTFVDRSHGRDEFRYILKSGRQGTVDVDTIWDYNDPPVALRDRLLRQLTRAAQRLMESTPLSIREISRRMSTSPAQIYRLLDEAHHGKSMDQVVCLLEVLGGEVDLVVR